MKTVSYARFCNGLSGSTINSFFSTESGPGTVIFVDMPLDGGCRWGHTTGEDTEGARPTASHIHGGLRLILQLLLQSQNLQDNRDLQEDKTFFPALGNVLVDDRGWGKLRGQL